MKKIKYFVMKSDVLGMENYRVSWDQVSQGTGMCVLEIRKEILEMWQLEEA